MIHQTKTKLFKIYMLLVAMVFLQSTYAQTINLNVSVNSLSHVSGAYGSNCGGNDGFLGALGNPDPRIMFRVKHSNTVTYSGEYKTQDPSGLLDGDFYNIACGTFLPILDPIIPLPYTQNNVPPASTINVQLDGYEYDRIDANDGSCGGYGNINGFLASNPVHGQSLSPAITSIPPATSSGIIESYRNGCASDDVTENYGARWSWTWTWTYISLTDDNSGGTVALSTASDAIICVGGDPGLINSTIDPLDPIPSTAAIDNIQWEVAQGPLFIYNAIGGANGLTYNPPVLITPGQYKYRRKVTFRTENLLIPDKPIYSNEVQINVVADPNAPTATKVPNTASVCLGTNLTLSTPQYGTSPGKSCGFEYSTSTNGGGTWSAPQATIPTISATGTNNLIRVRVAACTNGCDASNWTSYAWSIISDTAAPTISGNLNVCTGGQTTLTALAPVASTVRWFSDATLTVLVNSGITYTPTINSDTSFWVVQIQGDCQSRATRVNVTALPAPPAPDIIAEDQSICAGQNTNLISVVPTVVWYRDDSRTSRLGVGNIVNTGDLAFTTTFYAADTSGASCPSPLSSITIDVAPAPDVANVLDQIICAGDSILLSGGTATTEWYSDLALTDTLKIGSTFQTPALSSTKTYYLQVPSSCGNALDSVSVTVNPIPSAPTASDVEVCSGLSASISLDNTEPGAIVTWYDDVDLENAVQVGSVLITPILTEDKTYYVTQTVLGCTSPASSFDVIIIPSSNPPVLTADPVVVCTGDASTLSSNSSSTIWYSDAGQTRLGTGMSIVVIPTITTTYYAQDTAIGCSALSSVTVQVSTVLPTPSISDVTVCKGSDVTIGGGNSSTVWYELDQTTQLGTGSTLTLTSVQSTATYYARNEGSTCESAFDEFVVNVIELSKPTAAGTTICSGQSASLVATGNPNSTLTWYDDAALENAIQVGGLLNTPILTANTTYYVTQTVGSCTSDTTEVSVIVNPSGTPPVLTADPVVVCTGDASTLSSNSSSTIWYSDAGQTRLGTGMSIVVIPTITTTYYAQDTAIGCSALSSVTVQVSTVLPTPSISDVTVCKGSDVTIGGGNSSTVWYELDQTTEVGTGSTLILTSVQSTATYYARNEGSTCESAFDEFVVNVIELSKPTASGTTICSGQSASLVATGNPNSTLTWYDDAALENAIQVGGLLNTPILTANTTYYVTQTLNDCTSDTTQVSVIISSPVATPTLTANPIQVCSGSPTTLTSSAGVKTVWYSDAGITRVGSGATYTTPVLLSTSTFYAKDTTGCSSKLASIVIVVNPLPESPQAITPSPICAGSTATIQGGGVNTVWYSTPNAAVGTNIGAGPSYTTPILNGNTIYYLRNEIGNCKSAITSVTVTVKPKPAKPTVAGTAICAGSSATLNAVSAPQAVTQWYSNSTLTNMVQVGSAYNTPILNLTTSYYVTQTLNGCVSDTAVVTVIVNQKPTIPAVPSQEVCPGETPIFTASNPNNYVIEWYSDPLGTDVWGTGNAFIAPPAQQYTPWYYRPINSITGCKGDVVATWVEVVEARQVVTAEAEPTCVGDPIVVRVANYDFVGDVTIYDYDGNEVGYAEIDIADGVTEVELPAQNSSGYYNYFVIETGEIFCPSFPATFVVQVIDIPTINNISNDTICIGEVAVLTADSKDEIIWYSDVNLTTIVGTGNVLALTGLTETTNYYAVASNGTCKSEPIMATVVVNPLPAKPIVNANSPVCEGATISLSTTTTGNVTYNWTGPNGYTSNVQNPEITPAVKATHQGIYTLTIKDNTTGCTSMVASVQVDINPAPAAPTATNSGPVCEGANAIVSASLVTGAIYSWTGPNGFSSSLQVNNIMNVSLANAGTYSVSIYKDGCWSTAATTTLVVNAKPIIDSVVSNDPVCENQQIIITAYTTAQNINNYNWTVPDGNTINSTSNVLTIDTAEVSDRGMYILTITDANNCKSNPIAEYVDVNKYPDNIIATNNGPKCEGEDIQLNAPNIFGATYSWTGPNQFVSDLRNPTLQDVTVANAGTYTLVVSLGNCSSAPVTTDVVVHANPTANAGLDDTIYLEQPYKLNGSGGNDYLWTTGDYLSTTNIPNPIFLPDTVGIYTKTLTVWDNSTGCSDDDEVVITVLPSLTPTIPDLITPNGDGINDVWKLTFLNNIKESYVIGVYARGGALVMSTSNYNQDWSGTYKDKQLPDGAYWYAIELSNGVVYKGTLTIKR